MKHFILSACILGVFSGYGQNVVDVDKNSVPLSNRVFYSTGGHPVSTAKYIKLTSGSPYFKEVWMKGAISTPDSAEYINLRLRLDLLENSLLYLNDKNEEMISVVPINKVSLRDTVTGANYLFVHLPEDANTWYQVLTIGKLSLYKQHHKYMSETKAYASSITEQSIRTEERYVVYFNHVLTRIKKPKEIAELVPSKNYRAMMDYIEKEKLSGKKESDFIAAIEYYNSL